MVRDLRPALNRICEFLQLKHVCTEERMECVMKHSEGKYRRDKSAKIAFDPYTEVMKARLNDVIKEVKENLLKTLDIEAPWEITEVEENNEN